jgi:hypothetical protein
MANIKYADPTYTAITPTDDDYVMFRTGAGTDGRAPLVQPKGYIDGLKLEWVSGTQIRVTTGAAYVPGPKRIAELTSAVVLTPSLSASTWYHVYLTVISGAVNVEAVTTAPAAPYNGNARAKTGDTSRRYLGSVKTDGSSAIIQFIIDTTGSFRYLIGNNVAPLRCLANGKATVRTTVSLSGAIPVTSMGAIFLMSNSDTSVFANLSISSAVSASVIGIAPGGSLAGQVLTFPTDANQAVDYYYATLPANGLYIDVVGFTAGR